MGSNSDRSIFLKTFLNDKTHSFSRQGDLSYRVFMSDLIEIPNLSLAANHVSSLRIFSPVEGESCSYPHGPGDDGGMRINRKNGR